MIRFIARVELVEIGDGDQRTLYEELHEHMAEEGFSRQIDTAKGLRHLPDATYVIATDATIDEVLTKSGNAANKTRKKHRLFVAQMQTFTSRGLQHVEPEAKKTA